MWITAEAVVIGMVKYLGGDSDRVEARRHIAKLCK